MSKHFEYTPSGVCSRNLVFEIDGDKIVDFEAVGGCNGNLKGISALIKGRNIDEVIENLDGITCGRKPTSCPDQIARALREYRSH